MTQHGALPWFEPDRLTAAQRVLYDRIARGPRAAGKQAFRLVDDVGRLEGPFNALLVAPAVGTAVADLGSAIRYGGTLDARVREIAILEVAAERRSEFEWYAHEKIGRAIGLTEDELGALAAREPAASFDAAETIARELVRSLVRERDVPPVELERARATLGDEAVMELVALTGYYELLATSLRVWRTPLPSGVAPKFASDLDAAPQTLALERAQTIVTAAHRYRRDASLAPLAVAVLDARGTLVAFGAEDGTSLGRGAIAQGKANGALAMGFGSRSIAARAKNAAAFYASLVTVIPGGLVPAPGGVLVRTAGGGLLGAVGVSGDLADGDEAAAIAGIEAAGLHADPGAA